MGLLERLDKKTPTPQAGAAAQDKMQLQLNWFQLADHSPIDGDVPPKKLVIDGFVVFGGLDIKN